MWGVVNLAAESYHVNNNHNIMQTEINAKQVAQIVKNLPAMQETWVQSLGQEDPLEECMATHPRVFAWRILPGEFHGQRNLAGYNPWGRKESGTTERLSFIPFEKANGVLTKIQEDNLASTAFQQTVETFSPWLYNGSTLLQASSPVPPTSTSLFDKKVTSKGVKANSAILYQGVKRSG